MSDQISPSNYQEVVDRSNEIFKNFFPSIGTLPSEIKVIHMNFAIAVMYEARKACQKYGAAVELMKAIPDATPPNVGMKWLLSLGRKVIWAYFGKEPKLFKAVRDAVENGTRLVYQDLLDGRHDEVSKFLEKYKHIL